MKKYYLSIILVLAMAFSALAETYSFPPVDTDPSLTTNSDSKVPSQKAVKTYVDSAGLIASGTVNVLDYGAVGDYTTFAGDNAAISAGTNTLTCTTSRFTSADVGKYICVHGAGPAGSYLKTTIAGYTSGTQVTLTANASTTVSNAIVDYGTDSTTAIANAKTAAEANYCELYFPNGTYLTTAAITSSIPIRGQSKSSATIKIDAGSSISGRIISLSSGSSLKDITIDGYVSANNATSNINISGVGNTNTSAKYILVDNVNIINMPMYGIILSGSSKNALYWTVRNSIFNNCGFEGGRFSNVSHCDFIQNKIFSTGNHGFNLTNSSNIKFVGNTIDKETAPTYIWAGGAELGFLLCLDTNLQDILIDGNTLQNNINAGDGMDGIGLGTNLLMERILVCNNIIQNTGWFGIDMTSGMIMENNALKNTKYGGIAIETWGGSTLQNAKVTNNTIDHVRQSSGYEAYGIIIHGNYASGANYIENVQISGNKVIDTYATPTIKVGIGIDRYFQGHTTVFTNIHIFDNDLKSPTTSGYAGFSLLNFTEAQARNIYADRNILPTTSLTTSSSYPSVFGYDVIIEIGTSLDWLKDGYPGKRVSISFSNAAGCTIGFNKTDSGTAGEYGSGDGNLRTKGNASTTVSQNDTMECFTPDGITWYCSIVYNGTSASNETTVSATAPAAAEGKLWYQAATGRDLLWEYDGANWVPIRSYGAMTLYVDGASGTDSVDKGYGPGADAFATIQYAIDTIPPMVGGSVTINVSNATYAPGTVISGKHNAGQSTTPTITIQGVLSITSIAAQDSAVAGNGSTRGSITDTGGFNSADVGKLLYSSNNALYRVVYSADSNSNTVVGTWSVEPSGNYTRYGWGTKIDAVHGSSRALTIQNNTVNIAINDIWFYDPLNDCVLVQYNPGGVTFNRCRFENTASSNVYALLRAATKSTLTLNQCSFIPTAKNGYSISAFDNAAVFVAGCYFANTSYASGNILCQRGSEIHMQQGSSILHSGPQGVGVSAVTGGRIIFAGASASGYEGIAGCTTGISTATGGQVTGTANNIYSGNTADETATASSYGYID